MTSSPEHLLALALTLTHRYYSVKETVEELFVVVINQLLVMSHNPYVDSTRVHGNSYSYEYFQPALNKWRPPAFLACDFAISVRNHIVGKPRNFARKMANNR